MSKVIVGAVIQILLGLFIWMVLPRIIWNKRKYKKNTPQFFARIACTIVGVAAIVLAVLRIVRGLLKF